MLAHTQLYQIKGKKSSEIRVNSQSTSIAASWMFEQKKNHLREKEIPSWGVACNAMVMCKLFSESNTR